MLCEKCQQQPATVHMSQIINGMKTEIHLCQDCSMQIDIPISFESLFHGFLDSLLSMAAEQQNSFLTEKETLTCPACGQTYEGFKTSGKLGCAECYRTFANELETLLRNVQGSTRHEGKFPHRTGLAMLQKRDLEKMRLQMTKAIEEENFEEAAKLRDRIRAMEAEL